jgi:hypothetical protein
VFLALSFGRPVLVPDKGAMREQQERFGADWVRLYEGELGPRDLTDATAWATGTQRAAAPDLAGLDWESLARQTLAVYRELRATPRGTLARGVRTRPAIGFATPELAEDQAPFERDRE